ncbi:XRE family transcriptional regulator [Streptomyces sp. F-3]|jgi:transcriptional regulator with XRE-family HTH domain|uniref:helix-turn-helix domain-containing protein n=1 Tax=Streptomyces TaxID=1883 RepID=UPI0007C23308|nr:MULTISPECIES: helix-turn-helix transcriptional regulator [Streptomyces]MDN5382923.1 helix-turn-helix transcriptional regulator [Streptomyces sp. LB8]GAT83693.1 XRE family transcriptional regulator [Streptomyces sp. F-3]
MTSPSSSVQEARKAVADRLRHIRQDAGLTGRDLAFRCGWSPSKASRIENANTRPSDQDIREWCRACGAEDEAADLISASRTADSMYREWRHLQRTGMTRNQTSDMPLYQRTRHMRVYCSNVVPGLLQTQGYAEALLSTIAGVFETPNDAAEAAAARVERSKVLYDPSKRFALIVEEDVLYFPFGDAETMAGQLGYLLTVMALPSVSLGVIPRTAPRRMWTLEGFLTFDTTRVQVETLSANIIITRPSEIALYLRAFERFSKMAVYGAKARALILEAMTALG